MPSSLFESAFPLKHPTTLGAPWRGSLDEEAAFQAQEAEEQAAATAATEGIGGNGLVRDPLYQEAAEDSASTDRTYSAQAGPAAGPAPAA